MSEAALAEVSSTQVMCSKYADQPAIALYQWPWAGEGSSGACSVKHQAELRMTARNLNREIQFSPLPTPVAALSLDERIGLHARCLATEEELKASRTRGLELYNENTKLAGDVRLLRTRNASLEDSLKGVQADLDAVEAERDEALATAGEHAEENARLMAVLGRETALANELEVAKARIAELEAAHP